MLSELNEVWTTILGTLSACGGIGGLLAWRHNKKMRRLEAKLKATEVDKAKVESKTDEFHLYKEMLEHANQRNLELEKRIDERENYWQGECAKKDARYDEQTKLLRAKNSEVNAKDEQIQAEKDLNTEYERTIAELMEENTYLHSWVCRKGDCDNGEPPRGRLKGSTFDVTRLVRTGQRLKLLERKHRDNGTD
ncbi:MAG: hypothetical protein K2N48_01300 [Muribaculaceae bacterium]|nr:hypothetical protein [Muribaculaceae bacterium]